MGKNRTDCKMNIEEVAQFGTYTPGSAATILAGLFTLPVTNKRRQGGGHSMSSVSQLIYASIVAL